MITGSQEFGGSVSVVAAVLRRVVRNRTGDRTFSPDDRLSDLQVTSLELMQVIVEIEKVLGVDLPDDALSLETFESISSLAAVVDANRDGR